MPSSLVGELVSELSAAKCEQTLHGALGAATRLLGFGYFALEYGKCGGAVSEDPILIHDYPDSWTKIYLGFELIKIDPVRRASERSMTGFAWKRIEDFIPLTRTDKQIFAAVVKTGSAMVTLSHDICQAMRADRAAS